ncbi:MAG: aquaporin [Chloroflexota bacterium]|nr:aquaporin [Chloroflexota bacterium]
MNNLTKAALAEFVGTFALIFIGAAVVAAAVANGWDAVAPALGHGLVILGMAFAFGHISGANFNPAVTLGLLVGGKMKLDRAVYYWVAQFAGAIVAAIILRGVLPAEWTLGETTGALTADAPWSAAVVEAILTFLFVTVIFQTAAHGKAGNLAPIAIGLTLAACIVAGGAITGASLNPARTLGPALIAGNTSYLIPYLVGIFAGGALAGAFGAYVLTPDPEPQPAKFNASKKK